MESPIDAEQLAHRIALTLGTPFDVHGREVFVTASIGIAVAEEHSTGGELVRYADAAAYRAKERGRNCYEVFDEELRAATATALETETALHRALAEDQLVLHYQPIVDLDDRATPSGSRGCCAGSTRSVGCSARTSSSPPPRRPALIVPIGYRVVEIACETLAPLDAPPHARGEPLAPRARAARPRRPDLLARCTTRGADPHPPVPRDHRERAARGRRPRARHARAS